MSIIDQTIASQDLIGQLASSNCIPTFGCPSAYYPQPIPYSTSKVTIEAVEGGYIISSYFQGKGDVRTVALDAEGLAKIIKSWCTRFQAKSK